MKAVVTYVTVIKCQDPKRSALANLLKTECGIRAIVDERYGGRVAVRIEDFDRAVEAIEPFKFDLDTDPRYLSEERAIELATGE